MTELPSTSADDSAACACFARNNYTPCLFVMVFNLQQFLIKYVLMIFSFNKTKGNTKNLKKTYYLLKQIRLKLAYYTREEENRGVQPITNIYRAFFSNTRPLSED